MAKPKQTEQLPLEGLPEPRKPWEISQATRNLGRYFLPIARKRLFRTNTTYYVRHEDYDNHQVGVFGPMPDDADLNDEIADLWAQSGEIEVITQEQLYREHGFAPYVNPWSVWLNPDQEET